jgi:hypothetical protein
MLGHASAAMTLDVYWGLFDDDLDSGTDRLDAAAQTARKIMQTICGLAAPSLLSGHRPEQHNRCSEGWS